jgi:hypothetical protein
MATHLVSVLDVHDFGAEAPRAGDLNGDGAPDLLLTQSLYGTRTITCLTALTIAGEVLWQRGAPSRGNGHTYSDLPVQIYDWDDDGRNEVLYVQQARYAELLPRTGYAVERAKRYEGEAALVVLDGATGAEKTRLPLPAPADDCFLFADLTGRGRRSDLVVKDRYWNVWGVAQDGRVLWHWEGSPGHFPAIGDVDGDGCDEVFVGFALIDHDGRVIFGKDAAGHHQDAACAVRLADGTWRLLFGNHGLHCLAPDGRELWYHPLAEAQHVVPGRFRADSELQFMVINRGQPGPGGRRAPATLFLFDLEGRELWRREQPDGAWCAACVRVNWFGPGHPDAALVYERSPVAMIPRGNERLYGYQPGEPEAIYDGDGRIVDTFTMQYPETVPPADRSTLYYAIPADVWGDGRDEVILSGSRGVCIYANARPLAIPTLYNETLYTGA